MTDAAKTEQARAVELINELWNDGKLGPEIQRRAKEKFGDVKTTFDVVNPAVEAAMAPLAKQNADLADQLKQLQEDRAKEREESDKLKADSEKKTYEDRLHAARNSYHLTDEGFDKMIARMKETGNYQDPEAAAAYVVHQDPPKPVSGPTFGPQDLNLFGSKQADENMKQLHLDPQRYMDSELATFMRDPDAYVRETLGGNA